MELAAMVADIGNCIRWGKPSMWAASDFNILEITRSRLRHYPQNPRILCYPIRKFADMDTTCYPHVRTDRIWIVVYEFADIQWCKRGSQFETPVGLGSIIKRMPSDPRDKRVVADGLSDSFKNQSLYPYWVIYTQFHLILPLPDQPVLSGSTLPTSLQMISADM